MDSSVLTLPGSVASSVSHTDVVSRPQYMSVSYSIYIGPSTTIVKTGSDMLSYFDTSTTATLSGPAPIPVTTPTSLPLSIVPSDISSNLSGSSVPTTLVTDTDSPVVPSTTWVADGTTTETEPDTTFTSTWTATLDHMPPLTTPGSTAASDLTTTTTGSRTVAGSVHIPGFNTVLTIPPVSATGKSAAARGASGRLGKVSMGLLALCLIAGPLIQL